MDPISKYGVTFRRLSLDTLEMLRQWRNSDEVRLYMQYQKIISPEEQLQWFDTINNDRNYYFVAYTNEEPFGLYNVKDIDPSTKSGEAGVFLKNSTFWEGDIALRGSFLLADICFHTLGLEQLTATVLKDNKKAVTYNKQLGFKIDETRQDEQSWHLALQKEHFYSGKILRLIKYMEHN